MVWYLTVEAIQLQPQLLDTISLQANTLANINFYHLTTLPLGKALPRLLERVHKAGERVFLLTENEKQTQSLNSDMWTYTTKYFLPHGAASDPYPEEQPVFLSEVFNNKNQATILAFTCYAVPTHYDFKKCLYMFDGNDADQTFFAREKWKEHKSNGHSLVYWQQTNKGSWEEGAKA